MKDVIWGAILKPGKPYKYRHDEFLGRLRISQAILASGKSGMKTLMVVSDAGRKNPLLLCSLSPEKIHECPLNLELEEDDEVTFSVIGPGKVYLIGFYPAPGRAFDCHVSEDKSNKLMMEDGTNGELKDDGSQGFLDDDNDSTLPGSKSIVDNAVSEGRSNKMVKEDGTKESEDDKFETRFLNKKISAFYEKHRYKWVAGTLVFSEETDSESDGEYTKIKNLKNNKGKTFRIKTRAGGHNSSKVEMKKLKMKKRGKEVDACSNDNNRPSKRAAIIEVMDQDPCEPNANLLDDKSFDRSGVVLAGADGQNEH